MKYDEHSLRVLILHQYRGAGIKKRLIMFVWVKPLHPKFLLLQWLHNADWSCKTNKSNIIDSNTVLECFRKHQSHLQWITRTAVNAYDAQQTEMDSPQQTNDIVLGAGKVKGMRTTDHQVQIQIKKRIEIINIKMKNQSPHLIRQICQKLNTQSQFRKKYKQI